MPEPDSAGQGVQRQQGPSGCRSRRREARYKPWPMPARLRAYPEITSRFTRFRKRSLKGCVPIARFLLVIDHLTGSTSSCLMICASMEKKTLPEFVPSPPGFHCSNDDPKTPKRHSIRQDWIFEIKIFQTARLAV